MTQPVDAPISQEFGENPQNYARFNLNGHEGRDYACPMGTPVRAAMSGVAGIVAYWPTSYGNVVILHHPDGSGTIYGHLQGFNIGQGQSVSEGQIIGWSNNTGNSSGPHLHFGWQPVYMANLNNGYWGCADPRVLFNQGANVASQAELDALNRERVQGVVYFIYGVEASEVAIATWLHTPSTDIENILFAMSDYLGLAKHWLEVAGDQNAEANAVGYRTDRVRIPDLVERVAVGLSQRPGSPGSLLAAQAEADKIITSANNIKSLK